MKTLLMILGLPLILLAQVQTEKNASVNQQMKDILKQLKEQQKEMKKLGDRVSSLESVQQWFVPPPPPPAKPTSPGPPGSSNRGPPSSYMNQLNQLNNPPQ